MFTEQEEKRLGEIEALVEKGKRNQRVRKSMRKLKVSSAIDNYRGRDKDRSIDWSRSLKDILADELQEARAREQRLTE